jgi:hypothetical protein
MLSFVKIMEHVFAERFHPYRIRTDDGRSFDIRMPGLVLLGRDVLTLSTTFTDFPDVKKPYHDIPLTSVVAIEPLDSPVHQNSP